jgi:hypothetical protein
MCHPFKVSSFLYAALLAAVVFPDAAMAQESDVNQTRWGLSGSLFLQWQFPQSVANIVAPDNKVDISGREFTVGFVRGRPGGGDWGVSFIRKAFRKGSTAIDEREKCFGGFGDPPPCFLETTTETYNNATFPGVEAHWFIPIVRMGNRVQIGLNLAGGGVRPSGTMTKTKDDFIRPSMDPVFLPVHTEETLDMSSDWGPFLPVFKLEGQAAVRLGPGSKLKFGGGLSFPGAGFRVVGVHLFGAR